MVSARLLRRTTLTCLFLTCILFLLCLCLISQTGPNNKKTRHNMVISDKSNGGEIIDGARHIYEVAVDYEEVEYSSSVREKAAVDTILQRPWIYNRSAVETARKEMSAFFNPYKIITMTSDDAIGSKLRRFYHAKAIPINDVPPGISRLLPRKQLFRNVRYESCAVVGNGGILLNSSCGESINSKDFVIRCNLAEMEGYEADVGTKTDVLTFNPSIVDHKFSKLKSSGVCAKFLERLKIYGKYVLWLPIFSSHALPVNVRTILTFYERNAEHLKNVQLAFPGNFLPEILDFWMSKGVDEERISTGLLMYIIASTICDRIDLYGFYPFPEYNNKRIPYHYEDQRNISNSEFNSNYRRFHRLPDEFVYLKKMHRAGALQLHVGECDR